MRPVPRGCHAHARCPPATLPLPHQASGTLSSVRAEQTPSSRGAVGLAEPMGRANWGTSPRGRQAPGGFSPGQCLSWVDRPSYHDGLPNILDGPTDDDTLPGGIEIHLDDHKIAVDVHAHG